MQGNIDQLEAEFATRLRLAVIECHRIGYHPTRFEQMLDKGGAVATAKKLVISGDLQDGLIKLAHLGLLSLTMEAIMLEEQFIPLFTHAEREAAKWRLAQVKGI